MGEVPASDLPPVTGEVTELFFEALHAQEDVDVEALCRARPEHADEIRARFVAMHSVVDAFRRAGAEFSSVDAPAWDAFVARLSARGADVDRYEDQGEISHGGMGAVRRVFDRDLRRPLAMKRILESRTGDAMVGRFLEEAQVAGQLDHPGIVPVHELGVDSEGRLFFTMKLVEGEHFGRVIEKARSRSDGWSLVRALGVVQRAAEAVAFAHAKGVVHRDLKPENLMVGRFGEAYVMDWGLARVVGRLDASELRPIETERGTVADDSPLRTMEGEAIGTPFFMAPEQAQGRLEAIGPTTDVYAMGAILYQLLTGRSPYEAETRSTSRQVIDALLKGPPPPLRALSPDVPAELEAICERAMQRDVEKRYRTMAELADDLRAHQEHRVVQAHATGPWAELRKWVARNRLASLTAAAAGAVVIGLSLWFVSGIDRERRAAQESADVAQAINDFLTEDLLAAVMPSVETGRGRDVTMREVLDEASRRIEGRFVDAPAVEIAVRQTLGASYRELGEPAAAAPHLTRAVELALDWFGPDAVTTLSARNDLAMTYYGLGDFAEAKVILFDVVARAEPLEGGETEGLLSFRSNLAGVLRKLGEYERAIEIDLGVLEIRLREGRGSEASILTNLNGLALLYYEVGEYEAAKRLLDQAFTRAGEILGPRHPETLTYTQNVGSLLLEMGDAERAEFLYRSALEPMDAVFGREHQQTLSLRRNLAGLLRRGQRFDDAELLYEETLATMRAALGEDHVDSIACARDYAVLLIDMGELERAEPLLRDALAGQRQRFGEGHPTPLSTQSSLAVLLFRRDRFEEAGALFEEILARRRTTLGDDHPNTMSSMENLVAFLRARDRADEAVLLAEELVERTAADHPRRSLREQLLEQARADRDG